MLTPRHLSILRAALQYFDEELCPHGATAISAYLNDSQSEPVTPQQVKQLRQHLDQCLLRYALYDQRTSQLKSGSLFESPAQVIPEGTGEQIATLLLFDVDV